MARGVHLVSLVISLVAVTAYGGSGSSTLSYTAIDHSSADRDAFGLASGSTSAAASDIMSARNHHRQMSTGVRSNFFCFLTVESLMIDQRFADERVTAVHDV